MKVLTTPNEPLEKFRDLCCQAFDNKPELRKLRLHWPFQRIWSDILGIMHMNEHDFITQLCERTSIKAAESLEPELEALKPLQQDFAASHHVLPLSINKENKTCTFAVANPVDYILADQLRFIYGFEPIMLIAAPAVIEEVVQICYSRLVAGTSSTLGQLVLAAEGAKNHNENPIIALGNQLATDCVNMGVSDLHLQPFPGGGVARARIDGMLLRLTLMPSDVYLQLCRYIKAKSKMDTANERRPQDGRLNLKSQNATFDLRVSSLPAVGGERIVIRFLEQSRQFSLANQGFSVAMTQALRRLGNNSSGLVLITGPTGSGKTSTLYSMLSELNDIEKNIITVEDPVEYKLTGISQVNVQEKAGLSFASALRSILRQDPDIILIGEIRDEETAHIACQAAMTGHLVLSTLHTNDAFSVIPRLMDLGVKPTVLAGSLIGAIAQRLCRQLCRVCRVPVSEPLLVEEQAFKSVTRIAPGYRAVGCDACNHTGYSGRIPIAEIVEVDAELRKAIQESKVKDWKVDDHKLNSLNALSSSAVRHIISGGTSVKEAVRVLGNQFWDAIAKEFKTEPIHISVYQENIDKAVKKVPGVVILGFNQAFETELVEEYKNSWFDIHQTNSIADCRKKLEEKHNIVHVVVNLSASMTDEEICGFIQEARVELAWSRLPALLLLPADRPDLENRLREEGAISPCLNKPVEVKEVIKYSSEAATLAGIA